MKDNRTILIGYRLEQADESLESAQLLLENQKYRPSVSRSYYAMFYCVLALLVKEGIAVSKHTGVISAFNREFIKSRPGFKRRLICGRGPITGNFSLCRRRGPGTY